MVTGEVRLLGGLRSGVGLPPQGDGTPPSREGLLKAEVGAEDGALLLFGLVLFRFPGSSVGLPGSERRARCTTTEDRVRFAWLEDEGLWWGGLAPP